MLATAEEEDQRAQCIDDITNKVLPWSAVRQAGEQELIFLRDLGVYEKVDKREAIARYQVTPVHRLKNTRGYNLGANDHSYGFGIFEVKQYLSLQRFYLQILFVDSCV